MPLGIRTDYPGNRNIYEMQPLSFTLYSGVQCVVLHFSRNTLSGIPRGTKKSIPASSGCALTGLLTFLTLQYFNVILVVSFYGYILTA
jgi:hypothetical protein